MPRAPLYIDRDPGNAQLANAIQDPGPVDPMLALPLRAHSIANLAEMLVTKGSTDGIGGPRMCMLAGQLTPLDAAAGIFVWDPTSTLAHNATSTATAFTVANPNLLTGAAGRWRRLSTAPVAGDAYSRARLEDVKSIASLHP